MIIVMQPNADESAIERVIEHIRSQGLTEHISRGKEHVIIGVIGDEYALKSAEFERLDQVQKAIRIMHDWRMISREALDKDTFIRVRGHVFGGEHQQLMYAFSGSLKNATLPENSHSVLLDPFYVSDQPYALSGSLNLKHAENQLIDELSYLHQNQYIAAVRVRDTCHIQAALKAQADMLYLGGELLHNHYLLHEIGSLNMPVIVCKAKHHCVRDWLVAAEQIVLRGNQHIILGEAGSINIHSNHLRLDVEAIAEAKVLTHLPVLANISQLAHRTLSKEILLQLAKAAGADVVVL